MVDWPKIFSFRSVYVLYPFFQGSQYVDFEMQGHGFVLPGVYQKCTSFPVNLFYHKTHTTVSS